jgi:type I restriction enzyme M protein
MSAPCFMPATYVTTHRQQIVAAVENLWDKYRVSLAEREATRGEMAGKLSAMLAGLGYHGGPR